jgi:hypothetical protein
MPEPSEPNPCGLHSTHRLDHDPPPVTTQLGWRNHHIGNPTTVVRADEIHLKKFGVFVTGFSAGGERSAPP